MQYCYRKYTGYFPFLQEETPLCTQNFSVILTFYPDTAILYKKNHPKQEAVMQYTDWYGYKRLDFQFCKSHVPADFFDRIFCHLHTSTLVRKFLYLPSA